jgi:divalent metal cation (Fe/Co/Zn/Cd) transporter
MPPDACLHFYQCTQCKALLTPEAGDCCVFCSFGSSPCPPAREGAVRRGQWLIWATAGYNGLEGLLSVVAAGLAGSVALLGFGIDSFIEVAASLAAMWRLRADRDPARRAHTERRTLRLIGFSFLLLAAYILFDAVSALWRHAEPNESRLGIGIAVASLIVMPFLARGKRRVAARLASKALSAEARQTDICAYLSVILLAGLALNATVGWWWADPLAALIMVPLIGWEGIKGLSGPVTCDDCLPVRAT